MIGTTVGNYRIVERLGDGGMGAVFRAVDEMLDREVAIKVLKPELARNAALIERFRLEAVALARLNHPRIATLHGLERHGESLLMIMEYVRGETLEAIVQRSGRIAWTRAAELCAAVLDALDHAHDKGVVHRDIKPANIMLAHNGAVKVMDFGIARLVGKSRQTQVGHAVGTPMYMAPEQLRGEEVDGRTDLYAVGAVLFELVTGRMAFEADSDYGLMMKQLHEPPPAASDLVVEVPSIIDEIIRQAMAKRREDRFANAMAFREALELVAGIAAPPSRRTPLPAETRLSPSPLSDLAQAAAPASDPARPAFPATRLVSEPSSAPASNVVSPVNRSYESPALTRVASDHPAPDAPALATAESPRQAQQARHDWLRDWRTFAIAASLLVAIAVAVRALRPSPDPRRDVVVPADSTPVVARQDSLPTPTGGGARREDASALLINPPASGGSGLGAGGNDGAGRDVGRAVVPPVGSAPTPPGASGIAGDRPRDNGRSTPVRTDPEPAPPPAVENPRPELSESESEALGAIREALSGAAASLSGSNTGAAATLLGGGVQDQWMALMKEGRIALNVSGAPDIQLRGSRASAEFDATVNVRSPFGANRKRSARFSAELQRSGGEWRVTALRPQGGLELK